MLRQQRSSVLSPGEFHPVSEARRRAWLTSTLHLAVVAALLCLAAANIRTRAAWTELEDGVLWVSEGDTVVVRFTAG